MTSTEIEASRAVRSFGDVRVDRAKDAADVAVVVEADLHVVAPVCALDEFSLEASKALEHGSCPLKARRSDGQCLQRAHFRPPFRLDSPTNKTRLMRRDILYTTIITYVKDG
jgi:hypothetical protein